MYQYSYYVLFMTAALTAIILDIKDLENILTESSKRQTFLLFFFGKIQSKLNKRIRQNKGRYWSGFG